MTEEEYREFQAQIEEKKYRLEVEKERRSGRFFEKHFAVVLPSVVALAGVAVSFVTFRVGTENKKNEVERAAIEADQKSKIALQDVKQKRRLALLDLMDKHYSELFSDKPEVVGRVSELLLVGFEQGEIKEPFDRMKALAKTTETKHEWDKAERAAVMLAPTWYTFGGPTDEPYGPTDELAITRADLKDSEIAKQFLSQQPPGTSGMARLLNPDRFYLAIPRSMKPKGSGHWLMISNPRNDKSVKALLVDFTPKYEKDTFALSPGVIKSLQLQPDDRPVVTPVK